MITTETAREMTTDSLLYHRRDLHEVLTVQERAERQVKGSCPKLGAYWDEMHAIAGELKRRQGF